MAKKIINTLKSNIILIICIILLVLFCLLVKYNYSEYIIKIDSNIQTFFETKMISASNTEFMKNVTLLGSTVAIISIFILAILLFKNKIISSILSSCLVFILIFETSLRYLFQRARPIFSLIELPNSYSFPSGHTYFSVGLYGLIIYFLWKTNINKFIKYVLSFIISMIIIFIGISRIYLGVHYFSDVIGGLIFGIFTVMLFIGIYLDFDWGWKK